MKHKQDIYIFLFLAYKTLRVNVVLFFSIFFHLSFSDEKIFLDDDNDDDDDDDNDDDDDEFCFL